MIIVKFQGALGNQMFEYAFFQRLKMEYPDNIVKAYIPIIKDFNGYELDRVFGINIEKANWKEVITLSRDVPADSSHAKLMKLLGKMSNILIGPKQSHLKQDDNTAYYEEVFHLDPLKSYYLDGVWANSKYFGVYSEFIKSLFKFREPIIGKNKEYVEEIQSSNSISIHVRRNEYVSRGLTVVTDDYYKRAIQMIIDRVDNPRFFVFSDDHIYCKELFDKLIDYTLIEGNTGENSFRDMQLMTKCKHNILANSTFSFWGAFLGDYTSKIVIAPRLSWGYMKYPFVCDSWDVIDP